MLHDTVQYSLGVSPKLFLLFRMKFSVQTAEMLRDVYLN